MINKLKAFINCNKPIKIFINSIPKSGTHYLQRVFDNLGFKRWPKAINAHLGDYWMLYHDDFINNYGALLSGADVIFADTLGATIATKENAKKYLDNIFARMRNKSFFIGHALYEPFISDYLKEKNIIHVVLLRNPIDVVCALAKAKHDTFSNKTDITSKLHNYIFGAHPQSFSNLALGALPVNLVYKNMREWLSCENVYPFYFEDIIGDKGNGSTSRATKTIQCFLQKIHVSLNCKDVESAINNAFGNSPTFRNGTISTSNKRLDELDSKSRDALNECILLYEKIKSNSI